MVQIERQVRNIRYIAELTKFNLVPANVALEYLKTLLDNFIGNNPSVLVMFFAPCELQ